MGLKDFLAKKKEDKGSFRLPLTEKGLDVRANLLDANFESDGKTEKITIVSRPSETYRKEMERLNVRPEIAELKSQVGNLIIRFGEFEKLVLDLADDLERFVGKYDEEVREIEKTKRL